MLGLIDVGGGLRGSFTAGIYDWFLDQGLQPFDYLLGVSAGSANMVTFLAAQRGRNLRSYVDYAFRPRYMSLRNLIRTGSYLDLDYIYGDLCGPHGEDPIDMAAFNANPARYEAVVTDAATGEPLYFDKQEMTGGDFSVIKASCAVPGFVKPYPVHGRPGFDGGVADPVPWQRAVAQGCDRLVVLLTRPREYRRSPLKHKKLMHALLRDWPAAYAALVGRSARYNRQVEAVLAMEAQGKALLVAPTDISGMSTLKKDRDAIELLYHMGYVQGPKILQFIDKGRR